MKISTESNTTIPRSMWRAAIMVASQSFLFGYVFSCLNSCLVTGKNNSGSDCFHHTDSTCPKGTIYNDINLTVLEAQIATSLVVAGAWLGCLLASRPSELYGRKFTLLCNSFAFMVGAAFSSSGNKPLLFIGKFISGIGVGFASIVPPVLLSEIATAETRGTITTLHQVMLTLGILFASIFAYGVVTYVNHGWQIIQAFGAVPAVFMLIFRFLVPESPKWLLQQMNSSDNNNVSVFAHSDSGNVSSFIKSLWSPSFQAYDDDKSKSKVNNKRIITRFEVEVLLSTLRVKGHDINREINSIIEDSKSDESSSNVTWAEVFACKRAMIIGCGLMFLQAITGINSVTFYSTTIFNLAGFNESILGTASFGVVNFGMTMLSAYLVDKSGRKVLLSIGTVLMFCSLLVLSSVLSATTIASSTQGFVAVFAVLSFVAGFAIGLGAVVWVLMSEIMPTRLRVKAMSLFLSINWASNLLVGLVTLTAIDSLGGVKNDMTDDQTKDAQKVGVADLYFLFAGFTLFAIFFISVYVPETKGKNPEDLMNLSSPLLTSTAVGKEANDLDNSSQHRLIQKGVDDNNNNSI
eukprot:gene9278-12500_t